MTTTERLAWVLCGLAMVGGPAAAVVISLHHWRWMRRRGYRVPVTDVVVFSVLTVLFAVGYVLLLAKRLGA